MPRKLKLALSILHGFPGLVTTAPQYMMGGHLIIDHKLIMDVGIEKILSQARPKIRAIPRAKPHYNVAEMITQFKIHIWVLMETRNGDIFHASNYLMDRFDVSQRHVLENLGIEEFYAFL